MNVPAPRPPTTTAFSHQRLNAHPRAHAATTSAAHRFIHAAAYPGSWCQFVNATKPSVRYVAFPTRSIPGTSSMASITSAPNVPTITNESTAAVAAMATADHRMALMTGRSRSNSRSDRSTTRSRRVPASSASHSRAPRASGRPDHPTVVATRSTPTAMDARGSQGHVRSRRPSAASHTTRAMRMSRYGFHEIPAGTKTVWSGSRNTRATTIHRRTSIDRTSRLLSSSDVTLDPANARVFQRRRARPWPSLHPPGTPFQP